ncbi:hypothetical protein RUM44_008149 [Polyplax serrata]|uniref:ATP synthase F0 subunit 8 n=1 Tax=Polyplax serrata TaxID=468196 RepID=A0ABR1BBM2_POLSC
MADGFTELPIFLISLVAGAAVVVSLFVSKLVTRVPIPRLSNTDAQEKSKISESLCVVSKKSHQSHINKSNNKRKHEDKHVRDGKQTFNKQWLLTSLKDHSSSILDMEFSLNEKYLTACSKVITWF